MNYQGTLPDFLDDIEKLKSTQAGSVWFDAYRTVSTSSLTGYRTVTYNQVRKSPTTGNGSPDGISIATGIFVCPMEGAYKFDFLAEKVCIYIFSNVIYIKNKKMTYWLSKFIRDFHLKFEQARTHNFYLTWSKKSSH